MLPCRACWVPRRCAVRLDKRHRTETRVTGCWALKANAALVDTVCLSLCHGLSCQMTVQFPQNFCAIGPYKRKRSYLRGLTPDHQILFLQAPFLQTLVRSHYRYYGLTCCVTGNMQAFLPQLTSAFVLLILTMFTPFNPF